MLTKRMGVEFSFPSLSIALECHKIGHISVWVKLVNLRSFSRWILGIDLKSVTPTLSLINRVGFDLSSDFTGG